MTHQTSSFDSPTFFRNSCSCSSVIAMRLARNRVTSMSANQRTKCSASFSRAGRSVILSPRRSGPNMAAARIAAHAAFLPGGRDHGHRLAVPPRQGIRYEDSELARDNDALLGHRALGERGRKQHFVAALVADVELRPNAR